MKSGLSIAGAFAPLLCVVAASLSLAASPAYDTSLEYASCKADVVVRGSICQDVIADPPERSDTGLPLRRVTIEVHETMKGVAVPRIVLCMEVWPHDYVYDSEPGSDRFGIKTEAVFFLRFARPGLTASDAPSNLIPWVGDGRWYPVPLDGSRNDELFTADLRHPTSPAEILGAVRRGIAAGSRQWPEILTTSREPFDPKYGCWSSSLVVVPRDAALGRLALDWAAAPDETLRWDAVQVLRHDSSPASCAALRRIAAGDVHSMATAITREMTWDALQGFGLNPSPARPTRFVPLSTTALAVSVLAVPLPALLYVVRARRRRVPRSRHVVAFVTLLSLVGVACFRSYGERDALVVGNWEAAVCDGHACLAYRSRRDVGIARPLTVCRIEDASCLRAFFDERDGPFRKYVAPGLWGSDRSGSAVEARPQWTQMLVLAVPLWAPTAAIAVLWMITSAVVTARNWRDRRRCGFVVAIPAPA